MKKLFVLLFTWGLFAGHLAWANSQVGEKEETDCSAIVDTGRDTGTETSPSSQGSGSSGSGPTGSTER